MKKSGIYILGIVLFLMPILSISAYAYTDIEGNFAQSAIEKWSQRKIVEGSNEEFRPNDGITRGELAVIINRLFHFETEMLNPKEFKDLDHNFYTKDMMALYENKIMVGNNGYLRPKDFITRQEAVVIIVRAFQLKEGGESIGFNDDDQIKDWAKKAVACMKQNNFIHGYQNNFYPNNKLTRAEIITILDNMITIYIDESKAYDFENKEYNENGLVFVNAKEVSINHLNSKNNLIITARNQELKLMNSKINSKVVFISNKEKSMYLNNTQIDDLSSNISNLKIYIDKNSILPKNISKSEVKELKIVEQSNKNPINQNQWGISDEYKPILPDSPITQEENNPKKEEIANLVPLIEKLSADGKIHLDSKNMNLDQFELPTKAIIINMKNGENTGNPVSLRWGKGDIQKIKVGVKGEYNFQAIATEKIIINQSDYNMPKINVVIVVE